MDWIDIYDTRAFYKGAQSLSQQDKGMILRFVTTCMRQSI